MFMTFLRSYKLLEIERLILQAALDPVIASRAKKGEFVIL
jgi:hypothetical protein